MSETAVPAPDDKVPAADGQVVGTGDMTVPAFGCFNQFPEIVTPDLDVLSFLTDIFDPGYENPGCTAVVTYHLCLVRYGPDDLVGTFFTMIAVRAVPRIDEMFAHRR